jgi:hypothetical protein
VTAAVWGVEVNECLVFATGQGATWWAEALGPWEVSGRAVCLDLSIGGGRWFLPAGEREDADWMKDHITSNGVPAKAVKVRKAPATNTTRGNI